MGREIYLDNSATTRPFDEIIDSFGQVLRSDFGNPSSLHIKGLESEKIQKSSRMQIADSLGVSSGEIFFTAGGTESNNIALQGWVKANIKRMGTLVTSKIEHPSVMEVFKYFEKSGLKVIYLPVNHDGVIVLDEFKKVLLSEKVSLLSAMHVNNEVGSLQPISEIIKLKREYGFTFHCDAVQSFCKVDMKKHTKEIDFISFSGHKIHAFKGIGGLYINKKTRIEPVYYGGGQENEIRPGTENVPGIWSLSEAVRVTNSSRFKTFNEVRKLKDKLAQGIINEVPGSGINGSLDEDKSAPHIVNIWFDGIPGEVMLHALEEKGVYVSTGSACSARKKGISHVLEAMGVKNENAKSAIRFSLSLITSEEEIDYTVEATKECTRKLRR